MNFEIMKNLLKRIKQKFNFAKTLFMSLNKKALIRYQVLDKCFRNTGRMYFWEDLLEECNKVLIELNPHSRGIQRRQLFEDIKFMESEQGWSIPLGRYRFGKKVYYRYEDTTFSINNSLLNLTESEQLKSAINIISKFSGLPQFEWINEIITKLESKLNVDAERNEIISFEENLDYQGRKYLPKLFNAIFNKQVLKIKYKDFKSEKPYQLIFHPYYLKQYNSRWFVFGYNQEKNIDTWNLALDRIQGITEVKIKYRNCEIDWNDYFFDIIGVTRPQEDSVSEIQLRFSEYIAPYVISKPLHPTQKVKNLDTGIKVIIKVIPNYELEQLILSFGEHVMVEHPEELRIKLKERIEKMSKLYL